jgi:hypothetical protein
MEKGKRYLVLSGGKKEKDLKVEEIELLDITMTCYKINFIPAGSGSFGIDFYFNSEWFLKENFDKKYSILEELVPEKSGLNVTTTMDELFGEEKEKVKK